MEIQGSIQSDKEIIRSISAGLIYKNSGEIDITDHAFGQIDLFVNRYFDSDFCEVIINSLEDNTDLRKIARMLDVLIWSTPDNGTKLDRLIHDWIISDDKRKVQMILFREDDFPRRTPVENKEVLSMVKIKFPDLSGLCDYHINELEYRNENKRRQMDKFYALVSQVK
jgi:hypothetical protein